MLKTLLVEDDIDLANTIVQYLELEDIQCDHASNGASGLQLMASESYDVLLLDLNLPRIDGLTVCENLRSDGDDTPILMLTARDQLEDKITGFGVGADDYLIKPFELAELVVRITALSKRRSGQVKLLTYLDLEMNLKNHTVQREGQLINLSPIGWKILEHLLRKAPSVVSKSALEETIWGDDIPDSNVLKVHLHKLRKAIDSPFKTNLLQTIVGHGFAIKREDS